jgi:ribosome-associated protein
VAHAKPSKTARKKEQLALQDLGERLIGLSAEELAALPIDETLRNAVSAAASINSRGALRRQKQLIGKLMRHSDATEIQRALDAGNAEQRLARRVFADAESWRDRVIEGGGQAVADFRATVADVDETLDSLLRELRATRNERTAKHLRRKIFRVIHTALAAEAQDDRISR